MTKDEMALLKLGDAEGLCVSMDGGIGYRVFF